jgi:hypothetical protein
VTEADRPIVNDPEPREGGERERDLKRVSDFHAALLAMAGHDLRQPP